MNPQVDTYLVDGCGRCSFYQTPQCKVNTWRKELKQLRRLVLDCGLHEEFKWSQPCYTFENRNILLVTAYKEFAALAFIKGTLLKDPADILVAPGENSQAVRQFRFTNVQEIITKEALLKAYIYEALEVERAGLKVNFKKNPEPMPVELKDRFHQLPLLKSAFEALTAGRQRGYILYFSQPKQAKTRESRIEKSIERILNGKGLNDR